MRFETRISDWDGDDAWVVVDAFDMEHAADIRANEYYWNDPCDAECFKIDVLVREEGSDREVRLRVVAELDVNFHVREVEP